MSKRVLRNGKLWDKLLLLARGDLDLVQKAILASSEPTKGGSAELERVVEYIVKHRSPKKAAQAA